MALLMDGETARMVFTDPPYNVPIDGHVGDSGKTQHREFAMASGEMSSDRVHRASCGPPSRNMADHSIDGAIHFLCMDWRHMAEMLEAGQGVYAELKNLIVWVKDNGGMGSFYRSRQELIFAFKVGTAPHVNSFELGQHGRYRTNVWEYRGVNTLKTGRMDELSLHPTVKPVEMIADAIRDVSGRGEIVHRPVRRLRLDPDRGGEDRASGAARRTRPDLLRPHPRPLGELGEGRCRAAGLRLGPARDAVPGGGRMKGPKTPGPRKPGTSLAPPRTYAVGYGKPPEATPVPEGPVRQSRRAGRRERRPGVRR